MGNLYTSILFCWALASMLLLPLAATTQETTGHLHPLRDLEEGKHFFKQGLHHQARHSLEAFLNEEGRVAWTDQHRREAEWMRAQSALLAGMEDGEPLMLAHIQRYQPEGSSLEAMKGLADYYFNNKRYEDAIRYYESIPPTDVESSELARIRFRQGYAYYIKDRKKQAKEAFLEIQNYPGEYHANTHYYLGVMAFGEEDYEAALGHFNKAKKSPEYSKVMPYYLSQTYFALKDYPATIEEGKNALTRNKDMDHQASVVHLVAKSYFEMGQYKEALPYFDQYSQMAKSLRAQDLYQVAFTRYKTGDYDGAIKDFEELKSSQQSQMSQNALYNLGDSYLKKGDDFSARNAFYAASKMDYDPSIKKESHFLYGKLSYELGFDREALAAFWDIPQDSPHYPEARTMLSRIFLNTKDYSRAIEMMEQMPSMDSHIQAAYQKVTYLKGLQYYNDRDHTAATDMLLRSIRQTPDTKIHAQALFYLADMAHKQGQYSRSIQQMGQYFGIAQGYFGLPDETSPQVANYIQGYNYFKQKDYQNSSDYFVRAVDGVITQWDRIQNAEVKNQIMTDAILRAGDSFFMVKNFDQALTYYNTSIQYQYPGYDYAHYQKAVISGLQGNISHQVASLKALVADQPQSPYADDALLLLGNTYFKERNFPLAKAAAQRLVADYAQTSPLINQGYLLLGLVNYNEGAKEEALQAYTQVFAQNPSPEEYRVALRAIEEIYIDKGDPNGFIQFQERVLGRKVSDEDKEALVYKAAEQQYEIYQLDKAVAGYSQYLKQYPNGRFAIQAYYNRAEAQLASNLLDGALGDYGQVVARGNSSYYERALTKAANLAYNHAENFVQAYQYYAALAEVATDEAKKFEAQQGALRSAYQSGNKNGVYKAADAVLGNDQATISQKLTAHYYKAKMATDAKELDLALSHFREAAAAQNIQGAEARYQIAHIQYEQGKLTEARQSCMTHLSKSKNYEFWIGRGLLLFSDIATGQGDFFNARAALETLIENYDDSKDPGIIQKAKDRLKIIAEREGEESRIVPE